MGRGKLTSGRSTIEKHRSLEMGTSASDGTPRHSPVETYGFIRPPVLRPDRYIHDVAHDRANCGRDGDRACRLVTGHFCNHARRDRRQARVAGRPRGGAGQIKLTVACRCLCHQRYAWIITRQRSRIRRRYLNRRDATHRNVHRLLPAYGWIQIGSRGDCCTAGGN